MLASHFTTVMHCTALELFYMVNGYTSANHIAMEHVHHIKGFPFSILDSVRL